MVAARPSSLILHPSLLANLTGVVLAIAILLYLIPVPKMVQVIQEQADKVMQSKPKPQRLVFPIQGYSYSKEIITDRPGSPRSGGRVHAGVDLDTYDASFNVVSIMDGKIDELNPDSSVGGVIGITGKDKDGNAITWRYVHLDREPLRKFRLGQKVKAGQFLATVSTTFPGSSSKHLHAERYVNGALDWNVERSLTWTSKDNSHASRN